MTHTEPVFDVLPLHRTANLVGKRRGAVVEQGEDFCEGVVGRHGSSAANLFATVDAKYVARKSGKVVCVKKTLGDQVRDYMTKEGLNTTQMAERVKTSRQNIANVLGGAERPKCLPKLAAVMDTTVDALMAGTYVYGAKIVHFSQRGSDQAWPFERLPKAVWNGLSERQKGAIEDAALQKLREFADDAVLHGPAQRKPGRMGKR